MISDSAKELKSLRTVTIAAMLITVHTILSFFLSIPVTESLRISISFLANCVAGLFYGPVVGLICGAAGDVVAYIVKPTGPYFVGWTINAALAGFFYGMAFYKKFPKGITQKNKLDSNSYSGRSMEFGKRMMVLCQVILAGGVLVWFTLPFLRINVKNTETGIVSQLSESSAAQMVMDYIKGEGSFNAFILSVLIIAAIAAVFVLNFRKKKLIPMLVSLFVCCAVMLAVYTDKKTTSGQYGYWILIAVLGSCALINLVQLLYSKSLDVAYLLRCFIVMTVVAVFVNMLLGTYWCKLMYGNGFMYYFVSRSVKNIIQLPINTMLAYMVLNAMKVVKPIVKK